MQNRNFFLIGLVTIILILSIATLVVWKNSLLKRVQSYELIGDFESISGLLENAVVKYRGFPIGRVTKIMPSPKNIEVYFFVESKYKIPKGSTIKIVFDGLVGEKYMEIIPNPNAKSNYEPYDHIVGYSSLGLSDFIDVGTQNLIELRLILKTMSDVFGNQEISVALKDVVFTMQDAANNMNRIINELTKISNSNRLNSIIAEADDLLKNINTAMRQDDFQKVKSILENFESFSEGLKDITDDGRLKESILSTLDETRYTFEQSNNFFQTIQEIKLLTSADLFYKMGNENYMVYLLNLDFHLENSFLNIGFSNFYKSDKVINIILNSKLNSNMWLKYGLIKTSPGIGFGYAFSDLPLSTSIYYYNIEDPYVDIHLDYLLMQRLSIISGYNELNKDTRSVFIGASFKN